MQPKFTQAAPRWCCTVLLLLLLSISFRARSQSAGADDYIENACPCDNPVKAAKWKNASDYSGCVEKALRHRNEYGELLAWLKKYWPCKEIKGQTQHQRVQQYYKCLKEALEGFREHYIMQACPCDSQRNGKAWKDHQAYVKCVGDAVKKLSFSRLLSPWDGLRLVSKAAKTDCGTPTPTPVDSSAEGDSPGILTLQGASESGFNALASKISLHLQGAKFSIKPEDLSLELNTTVITPADVQIGDTTISFTIQLADGSNELAIYGLDQNQLLLQSSWHLWAGAGALTISVLDVNGSPVGNASVKVALSDDESVIATGNALNGSLVIPNVPSRTLIATATTEGNLYGSAATVGAGSITIRLKGFSSASTIDNNDISLGTGGWDIGTSPVTVVQHQDEDAAANGKSIAPLAATPNQDLQLSTSGEGPRTMSRTFVTKTGTKNVTLRYRFITTEVPGGYYGSKFNDYFSVAIRSKNGNTVKSEENSMNGLGLSAFDYASGATSWREVSLPVSEAGDIIQADVLVANVGDGLYDSRVEVDYIEETKLSISSLILIDPDQVNTLTFLSIDNHTYFNGKTRVHGKITVEGDADDALNKLTLEVLKDGNIINTVDLASAAQPSLYKTFGSTGKIALTTQQLLFELPSTAPLDADGKVLLRVKAATSNGQSATKEFASLPNLRRYTGTNRYGGRDEGMGGDDWALPSTISYMGGLSSDWTFGDVSNMNANNFPPHATHNKGIDMDVWFDGYNERDAATAATLIDLLNGGSGAQINKIFVTYTKTAADAFYNAIKDVTLSDSRKAIDVIRPVTGHDTHFHIQLRTAATATLAPLLQKQYPPRVPPAPIKTSLPASNISIYPNPAVGQVTVTLKDMQQAEVVSLVKDIRQVKISDKLGNVRKIVYGGKDRKQLQVNLSDLSPDIYVFEVSDGLTRTSIAVMVK